MAQDATRALESLSGMSGARESNEYSIWDISGEYHIASSTTRGAVAPFDHQFRSQNEIWNHHVSSQIVRDMNRFSVGPFLGIYLNSSCGHYFLTLEDAEALWSRPKPSVAVDSGGNISFLNARPKFGPKKSYFIPS